MRAPRDGGADAALRRSLAATLPWLAWGLALFYVGLTLWWVVGLEGQYPELGIAWGATAAVMVSLGLRPPQAARRWPGPELAAAAMAGIVAFDSLLLLAVTREPAMAVALFLTIIGFAFVVPRGWMLGALVGACWAGFLAVAAASPPDPEWLVRGITLAGVSVIAFAAQRARHAALERLAELNARDVEAARRTAELDALRRQAEERAAFVRLAAHELATPLTPIVLQAHSLQGAPSLPAEHRAAVERLARNARRLERLVNDLVAVARGGAASARQPVDLAALVRAEVEAARATAEAAGVSLSALPAGPGHVTVVVDRVQVAVALRRLLDNALKFTPRGGSVEAAAAADGPWAELRVSDTGRGVDPEAAARIFEPFVRPDPQAGDAQGAGLGLAVVRQVAVAHGGDARHEPRPGGGSIFVLRLPAA